MAFPSTHLADTHQNCAVSSSVIGAYPCSMEWAAEAKRERYIYYERGENYNSFRDKQLR